MAAKGWLVQDWEWEVRNGGEMETGENAIAFPIQSNSIKFNLWTLQVNLVLITEYNSYYIYSKEDEKTPNI